MSSHKSQIRAKRIQTIIAIMVLFAMIMGGATFILTVNTTQSPSPPSSGQSL